MKHADGLAKALAYAGGTHTVGDVLRAVLAGDAQLHETDRAAIVTEVYTYPRKRVVNFWLATGELNEVIRLSHEVMEKAKNEWGCEGAIFTGRRGWEPVLTADGWNAEPMVLMSRQL